MKILLVNDDGIESKGLLMMAKTLSKNNEVYVFAPESERSGYSQYVTFHKPVFYQERIVDGAKNAYAVSGTPVDCVKLAIRKFKLNPDIVVSGPNRGANHGSDILYSGTVGAAQEAAMLGYKSVSISSAENNNNIFETCCYYLEQNIDKFFNFDFDFNVININVPNTTFDKIKGTRVAFQGAHCFADYYKEVLVDGQIGYSLEGDPLFDETIKEYSDVALVREGYITVTALNLDRTNYQMEQKLREIFE